MAELEERLSGIPLISPRWTVIAGALMLLAIALPAAAHFRTAGPVPADIESGGRAEAMDYLSQIGFGVEYGSTAPVLHKWKQDVTIKVHGWPTDADLQTLEQVVSELNSMLVEIDLELVDKAANLEVYFSPQSHFSDILPEYVPTNLGFSQVWFDGEGVIQQGRVLIAADGTTQAERTHLIRAQITQSLGLFKHSWEHSDSIFYQGWTTTDKYSPLDEATIRLLYQPQLEPGMNRSQVRSLYLPTE